MRKLVTYSLAFLASLTLSSTVYAGVSNYDASSDGAMPACANGAVPAGTNLLSDAVCRTTPTVFKVTIYEMGLCTAHPFANGTGVTMDKSTCSVVFSNTAGSTADIASSIGGEDALEGDSFPPPEGTFKYPYAIMGTSFTVNTKVKGEVGTAFATKTYATAADGSYTDVTAGGNGVDFASPLSNFGSGKCVSGYINGSTGVGTIDGYLTNTALVRRDDADYTGAPPGNTNICTGQTRLVGVFDLSNPFTITPNTRMVKFNFVLTDYGVQVEVDEDTDANPGKVKMISSAPFSAYFEAVE
ncbi:hypothetical protein N8977_04240 [Alphaproteobacteria bacterium]|nr:hypothetical protein [Alphaproteobacteria bacterium]